MFSTVCPKKNFPTWENKVYSYLLILKVEKNRKYSEVSKDKSSFKDERIIWSKGGRVIQDTPLT